MHCETVITRHLAIIVILSAIAVGFDWIAAILGLAAVGVLVMAGLQYHHEMCHTGREERGDIFH